MSDLTRELLREAYRLFTVEDHEVGSDEWAWCERTRCHLDYLCPYPIHPDDGTQKQCIENGHCGCVYGQSQSQPQRDGDK